VGEKTGQVENHKLPTKPGMWGFKAVDMEVVIERIDIEL
jgi:hypothetical protein